MLAAIYELKLQEHKTFLETQYSTYAAMLHKLADSIVHDNAIAGDIVTDAMLSLFSLVPKLQAMEETDRIAYLKATVRNAAYKRYNADKRNHLTECVPIEDVLFSLPAPGSQEPEEILIKIEEYEQVRKAIATLPEKDRIVLHLKYAAQLSAQEIMEMTSAPSVEAVNTQLSRARKKVLRLLEDGGIDA